jgi:hypothetical protein
VDKKFEVTKLRRSTSEPPIRYKLRYCIIPPRIARTDEVIEWAYRHVGFWHLADVPTSPGDVCIPG